MRICRILTNNALVVLDEKGKEQIVCGKGIGYKKRPGDNVDDKLVETVYVKEGDQSFEQIRRTLEALPEEYLLLAQHIVEAANVSLNMKLNPVMAVSLADHLFYAIQRFLEGTPIANSLTWEIKRFYQKEYEVGLMALDMVESQFKVRLPESEAAFIAMHIANGETDDSTMEETFAITKIIEDQPVVEPNYGLSENHKPNRFDESKENAKCPLTVERNLHRWAGILLLFR